MIIGRRNLEQVLRVHVEHHNAHIVRIAPSTSAPRPLL
jgi:hypothetical protein